MNHLNTHIITPKPLLLIKGLRHVSVLVTGFQLKPLYKYKAPPTSFAENPSTLQRSSSAKLNIYKASAAKSSRGADTLCFAAQGGSPMAPKGKDPTRGGPHQGPPPEGTPRTFNKVNSYSSYKPQGVLLRTPKGMKSEGLKIKRVMSLSQILGRIRQQRQKKLDQQKRQKPIKPIIPPKSLIIVLKDKPEKAVYNRRIIDYKHCGLLQRYVGLGGKILSRKQTRLTAKQQRYVAKTIKSARIMGLLPFVSKERGFFK